MKTGKVSVQTITRVGVLAAMAIALSFLESSLIIPTLPFFPNFLKLDIGDLPALLAAFAFGPLAGIFVEVVKNAVHLFGSQTSGVGELANMIIGSSFVATAGLVYRMHKTRGAAYAGMALGTLVMTAVACAANYYVLLPLYINMLHFPLEAIVGLSNAAGNFLVKDMPTLILYVFVPFNLIKGLLVSVLTGLVYKRVSPLLHGVRAHP
jgi:riboflavin transporter FmnP